MPLTKSSLNSHIWSARVAIVSQRICCSQKESTRSCDTQYTFSLCIWAIHSSVQLINEWATSNARREFSAHAEKRSLLPCSFSRWTTFAEPWWRSAGRFHCVAQGWPKAKANNILLWSKSISRVPFLTPNTFTSGGFIVSLPLQHMTGG